MHTYVDPGLLEFLRSRAVKKRESSSLSTQNTSTGTRARGDTSGDPAGVRRRRRRMEEMEGVGEGLEEGGEEGEGEGEGEEEKMDALADKGQKVDTFTEKEKQGVCVHVHARNLQLSLQ